MFTIGGSMTSITLEVQGNEKVYINNFWSVGEYQNFCLNLNKDINVYRLCSGFFLFSKSFPQLILAKESFRLKKIVDKKNFKGGL